MKLWKQRPRAWEPHWPLGYVGRFYIKQSRAWGDAEGLMAVEKLIIRRLTQTKFGWTIVAGDNDEWTFNVNPLGESHECVPWDGEMEEQYRRDGGDLPLTTEPPPPRVVAVPQRNSRIQPTPRPPRPPRPPGYGLPDFTPGEVTEHKEFELRSILSRRKADLRRRIDDGEISPEEVLEAEAVIHDVEHRADIAELRETAVLRDEVRRGLLPKALLELDDDIAKLTAKRIKEKAERQRVEARKRARELSNLGQDDSPEGLAPTEPTAEEGSRSDH